LFLQFNSIFYFNESVKFSKVSSNNLIQSVKRSKFEVATEILQNKLNTAKRSYRLSKIQTFFKRVERLAQLCPTGGPAEGFVRHSLSFRSSISS